MPSEILRAGADVRHACLQDSGSAEAGLSARQSREFKESVCRFDLDVRNFQFPDQIRR
jgi:hypothetical protein